MYLNHLTLTTGHLARSGRADVTDDTIKSLQPWLKAAIEHVDDYPLPGPLGKDYRAKVIVQGGALVCTVFGAPLVPLVTFGVAVRSRHSAELWAMMSAQFGVRTGLQVPGAPWCAVALHPGLIDERGVSGWVGDFERCVAWAWMERNKDK